MVDQSLSLSTNTPISDYTPISHFFLIDMELHCDTRNSFQIQHATCTDGVQHTENLIEQNHNYTNRDSRMNLLRGSNCHSDFSLARFFQVVEKASLYIVAYYYLLFSLLCSLFFIVASKNLFCVYKSFFSVLAFFLSSLLVRTSRTEDVLCDTKLVYDRTSKEKD